MTADHGAERLVLENRHAGERLAMRRVVHGDDVWLELQGSLPPYREGPPMHVHLAEDEEGRIKSGTLSAAVDGRRLSIGPGGSTSIPSGAVHRWWNDGNELLVFEGHARPVVDLDRYLRAIFDIMNAALRYRRTQAVLIMPRLAQTILFRVLVTIGAVLGKYDGDDWPGCPSRCSGAPLAAREAGSLHPTR